MDLWNYFENNTGKKITKWKHYFPVYEKHFGPIRNKPIKILEIGVLNGGSLEMWRYYFPEATIVGIDIDPNCKQHEQEGINIRVGDQTDEKFLQSLIDECEVIVITHPVKLNLDVENKIIINPWGV